RPSHICRWTCRRHSSHHTHVRFRGRSTSLVACPHNLALQQTGCRSLRSLWRPQLNAGTLGRQMHCPKCAAMLEEDPRGWLRCSSGELEFSMDLSRKLRERYPKGEVRDTAPDFSGRSLFCPGCAIPLATSAEPCPSCRVSLKPLLVPLIEWHPHGDGSGKYF